jgi:signal peptidase
MRTTPLRSGAVKLVEVVVIVLVVSLLLGQALGQPVLLGFVETGSMAPTLDPGDGFIAIPSLFTDSVEQGDVIVFRAKEIQGGGLTTHRVVDETDRGYITRGDANAITDQQGGEPVVREPQIVAEALQIGGHVVVVPNLGDGLHFLRESTATAQRRLAIALGRKSMVDSSTLLWGVTAGSFVGYFLLGHFTRDDRDRSRSGLRSRDTGRNSRYLVGAITLVLVCGLTLPMVVPTGTTEFNIVSASFESDQTDVVQAGEKTTQVSDVSNPGLVPVVVYFESKESGVDVEPRRLRLAPRTTQRVSVTLHAPEETGSYRRYVGQYRYLAVLPPSILDTLYEFHPVAPVIAIDALVGIPFYLIGINLVGGGRVRRRSRPTRSSVGWLFSRD